MRKRIPASFRISVISRINIVVIGQWMMVMGFDIHRIETWWTKTKILFEFIAADDVSDVALSLISADTTTRRANEMSFRTRPVRELISGAYKTKHDSNDTENSLSKPDSNEVNNYLDSENSGKTFSYFSSFLTKPLFDWTVTKTQKIHEKCVISSTIWQNIDKLKSNN